MIAPREPVAVENLDAVVGDVPLAIRPDLAGECPGQ